jgi:hypothetical protein
MARRRRSPRAFGSETAAEEILPFDFQMRQAHAPSHALSLPTNEGAVCAMARVTGLEPATSGVTGRRSNQLSYTPAGDDFAV